MPSTTSSASALRALTSALRRERSQRKPLLKLTCAVATTRVRASTSAASASGGTAPSAASGASRTSTPRGRKFSHGKMFDQCSPPAGSTTLSPARRATPAATAFRP
jgi:hypothetical protein